jgi:hypothetical protein
MRLIAVALPALILISALPSSLAYDECDTLLCAEVSTNDVPQSPARTTYYVYLQGLRCAETANCRGTPPASFYGLIWEESNGLLGLQRSGAATPQGFKPADAVILA